MMIRLFVSLYLGIMATLFAFVFVAHIIGTYLIIDIENVIEAEKFSAEVQLLEQLSEHLPQVKIKELLKKIGEKNQLLIKEVNASDLPMDIHHQLEDKQVWFDDYYYDYFRAFNPVKYYRLSKNEKSELLEKENVIDLTILGSLIFLVALCCFVWLYGLLKKLRYLEITADKLSKGDLHERAPIGKRFRVGRLNQRFNEMAERIEQLVLSHKQLTQTVAHELRSPLFRLHLQLDLLEQSDAKERQKYLQGIEDDIYKLDELVDEFLEYGKMYRAELRLNTQPIVLHPFIEELCQNLALESHSSIEVNIRLAKDIELIADKPQLTRALTNLLRNAIKYGEKHIRLVLECNDNNLIFIIEDDGSGIPEQYRDKIFEPYYRLNSEEHTRVSGYGLGLAICKEIASLHNGQLSIDDSSLGGAMFTLTIPMI
jgi:two-component system sensor histidine kinase RstB